jgi:tricorn protease-like protein
VVARACYVAILTLNQVLWLLVVEFYRITYSPPPLGALTTAFTKDTRVEVGRDWYGLHYWIVSHLERI